MSKHTELAKNTLIISLGRFSTQLISLLLLPIYTVYLSPADYGLVDLIITYIGLLVPAMTIQMEMAGFRFLIDARGDEDQKKKVISNVLQIVSGILVGFLALYLVFAQFIDIRYSALIVLNICVTIFSNLFLQFARGLGDNKRYAIASTVTAITTLAATALFVVRARQGAGGVLAALVLANLASVLYLLWSAKLHRYIRLGQGSKALKRKLLHYSLPLVPNGLSWWIIGLSDRTIIALALGLAANGIYAVSAKYTLIYASLFAIFSMALTEAASVHINAKDRDSFLSDVNTASLRLFGSLGLLLIALCPVVFHLFIGVHFQAASNYVPILIVAAFFNAIVGIYSAIYVAKKMTKQVMNTSIAAAVINVALTVALIPFIGIYAAALATAAAYLVMAVFRHHDLKKIVRIRYEKWLLAKIALAYGLVIGLFYLKNDILNIINIFVAVAISLLFNRSIIGFVKENIIMIRTGIKAKNKL